MRTTPSVRESRRNFLSAVVAAPLAGAAIVQGSEVSPDMSATPQPLDAIIAAAAQAGVQVEPSREFYLLCFVQDGIEIGRRESVWNRSMQDQEACQRDAEWFNQGQERFDHPLRAQVIGPFRRLSFDIPVEAGKGVSA